MNSKRLGAYVAYFLIGIMFVLSGIGKMMNAHGFGEMISSYGLEWFSIMAPFIIVIEIAIGLGLLLRIVPHFCLFVSIIMLVIFTIAFFYANVFHGINDCGCFGNIETKLPVWITYLRNIAMLVIAVALWRFESEECLVEKSKWVRLVFIIILLVCTFWSGHTWQPSSFYMSRFAKPHRLLGQEVNKTPLADYFHASPDSTYLVWVFSYECGGCITAIENIKQYQKGVADHFISLAVTEDKTGRKRKLLNIPFSSEYVGDKLAGIIKVVPTLLYIEKGRIKFVIEESVPNLYSFKSNYLEMTNDEILKQQSIK